MAKCEQHDSLEKKIEGIDTKVDKILERLGSGDCELGKNELRISFLEKLLYGVLGLALTAMVGAVLALVIKSPGVL